MQHTHFGSVPVFQTGRVSSILTCCTGQFLWFCVELKTIFKFIKMNPTIEAEEIKALGDIMVTSLAFQAKEASSNLVVGTKVY